jgi:hypothetical protein
MWGRLIKSCLGDMWDIPKGGRLKVFSKADTDFLVKKVMNQKIRDMVKNLGLLSLITLLFILCDM